MYIYSVDTDEERLDKLLSELEGKDVNQLISEGSSKLASVPSGGASSGGAAPAAAAGGAAPAEEKKEEKKEEEKEGEFAIWLMYSTPVGCCCWSLSREQGPRLDLFDPNFG